MVADAKAAGRGTPNRFRSNGMTINLETSGPGAISTLVSRRTCCDPSHKGIMPTIYTKINTLMQILYKPMSFRIGPRGPRPGHRSIRRALLHDLGPPCMGDRRPLLTTPADRFRAFATDPLR